MNNNGRKRVRRARKNESIKRILLTVCMMAMVAALSIGGTLAWLTDNTQTVTNTFEAAGIDITLVESPLNTDGSYGTPAEGVTNTYKVIPGKEYTKDPVVKVLEDTDVPVYLFVKFEEVGNPSAYYTYTSTLTEANEWKLVEGTTDVWYREVAPDAKVKEWHLLLNDKIAVQGTVEKGEQMTAAAAAKLVYTAYAIQTQGPDNEKFTPKAAWTQISTAN